jgi:hypothetical protein
MPTPIEICLEDLDLSPEDERYIRCVALPGGQPGLALDREGAVRWMPDGPAAYGLWVSADDKLVLRRGDNAGPITVVRGGRSLEAPATKPVVLLHGDLLQMGVNGRRLRVHVHGTTGDVYEPEPLSRSALARLARTAAAALALGAAVGAGIDASAQPGTTSVAPIEVRARPPAPPAMRPVTCTITKMTPSKKGPLMVHATCPAKERPLHPGAQGQLIGAKGETIKNGTVVVKQVKGNKIVGETQLTKQGKATAVRFYRR